MVVAALAALLAVARTAVAQTGSPEPVDAEAARANGEAFALIASMTSNARVAREALELARTRRRPEEVRCSDEALSRADVALRRGREDAAQLSEALATRDSAAAASMLRRLRARATASHDAASTAGRCIPQGGPHGPDRTQVTVHVETAVPPIERALP